MGTRPSTESYKAKYGPGLTLLKLFIFCLELQQLLQMKVRVGSKD